VIIKPYKGQKNIFTQQLNLKTANKTIIILFYLLFLFLPKAWCLQNACLFLAGDNFPEIIFQAKLSTQEKDYLAVPANLIDSFGLNTFTLFDIKAELVIVEFLNVYCVSCQEQAPVLNSVYDLIQKDKYLKEKVKLIGICPGNNFKEMKKFKNEKAVPFPFIPDPDFEAYEALGYQCGTPLIIMVRRVGDNGIITWSHIGQISSPLYFVQEAWDALNTDLDAIAQKAKEKRSMKIIIEQPKPYISDEEMGRKILVSMESQSMELAELKKVALSEGRYIFMDKAFGKNGEKHFFSKLISRNAVCDLCHAIHFILTFDESGKIVDFDPIHITKYDNELWSLTEIIQTKKKLIGKSILKPLDFNPEVDAVSLATMSSALIYNSIERTKKDYQELQKKGYIK
jgi:peroxiredoxin